MLCPIIGTLVDGLLECPNNFFIEKGQNTMPQFLNTSGWIVKWSKRFFLENAKLSCSSFATYFVEEKHVELGPDMFFESMKICLDILVV